MTTKEEQLKYDQRVKERVLILQQMLAEGKISLVHTPELEASWKACRFDSSGEVDLSTVNGAVRSLALMAAHQKHREEWKEAISLYEIQRRYFSIIDANFKFFYDKMVELNYSPHQIAYSVAYDNNTDYLRETIPQFLQAIVDFWEGHSEAAYIHVEDMDNKTIKGVLGGDLFAANNENIASKCGIYIDTIVLPCPYIRSYNIFSRWDKQEQVYFLIKHALNVLKYKELAMADIPIPIVVILPDKEMMPDADASFIVNLGEQDALVHSNKVFGTNFTSWEEVFDYAGRFDTIEKLMPKIADKARLLFDLEDPAPIDKQLLKQFTEYGEKYGMNNIGVFAAFFSFGRMSTCNELLYKSLHLHGTPIIEAPTSWEYFKWKLEYDAERSNPGRELSNIHIVKGLNHISDTSLKWIGNIPVDGLIEIRKNGAIDEIREIVSKGIDELTEANSTDFTVTSHRVFNNLNAAFKQHEDNIKELTNKSWKIAGKDIGSWLVVGSIELAAACTGQPLYGFSALMLNQILDAPKLKDLPKSAKKIKQANDEKRNLKRSPVGLMFSYKK